MIWPQWTTAGTSPRAAAATPSEASPAQSNDRTTIAARTYLRAGGRRQSVTNSRRASADGCRSSPDDRRLVPACSGFCQRLDDHVGDALRHLVGKKEDLSRHR